jgi:hypothetical protein
MKKGNPENILSISYPELLKEWDYQKNIFFSPETITYGSNKKVWWKCKNHHEWEAIINSRSRDKRGCPYCTNQKICIDNCLATKRPDLLSKWDYQKNKITPYNVSSSSGKKVWWKCINGHGWEAIIGSMSAGSGCPYCSGQKVCNDNCLLTVNPILAKEWNYEKNLDKTPKEVGANSPLKYWWKCCNGHEWTASINNRNRHNRGCAKCRKYILEDGTACDSLIESFYYLKYKDLKLPMFYDKQYPKSKLRFDFYFPNENKYVEVTSFTETSRHGKEYYEKIKLKKFLVEQIGASFEFICRNLNKDEMVWIKERVVGRTLRNKNR